jgi:hypothetical protein
LKGQTAIPDSRHRGKKQPDFQNGDEAKNERFSGGVGPELNEPSALGFEMGVTEAP